MRARSERRSTSTALGARQEGAHHPPGRRLVRAEHAERIAVQRVRERLDFVAPERAAATGAVRTFIGSLLGEQNARRQLREAR